MPFELIHFRDSDKILKSKKMEKDVQATLEYVNDCLYGTLHRGELLRQALEEMEWRRNDEALIILDGRRYRLRDSRRESPSRGASQRMSSFWKD
jgi:hypothetical protein